MSALRNIETINHLDSNEKKWFAIYTKYKCEKYVLYNLQKKGVTAFVPLLEVTKQYARKVKTYEIPLINCYAFVKINRSEYIKVLESQYVNHFVKIRKNLISIPNEEIDILKRVVGEIEEVQANQIDFRIGHKVEIIAGNLTGLHGTLIDQQGKYNFVVQLETLGYQLAMNVDANLLKHKNDGVLV